MTKAAAFLTTALVAIALLYSVTQTSDEVKDIIQTPLWFATDCTKQLQIQCAVDIEKTVRACSAAFETGGSDIIADIKCAKDLMADKKHCWPCICAEAKKKGWNIIGC